MLILLTNYDEQSLKESAQADGIGIYAANALIRNKKKLLLVRRHPNDSQGGMYEFPGGKVEKTESLLEGLSREVFEETGLIIEKVHEFVGHFDFVEKGIRQFNFLVEARGDVRLSFEHDDYRWVEYEEFDSFNLTEGTKTMVQIVFALDKQNI